MNVVRPRRATGAFVATAALVLPAHAAAQSLDAQRVDAAPGATSTAAPVAATPESTLPPLQITSRPIRPPSDAPPRSPPRVLPPPSPNTITWQPISLGWGSTDLEYERAVHPLVSLYLAASVLFGRRVVDGVYDGPMVFG